MTQTVADRATSALMRGFTALLTALRRDDVVLMGRWARVLGLVQAAPPAPRALGA